MGVGGALNKFWRWRNHVRVWMGKVGKWAWLVLGLWKESFLRGSNSLFHLGSAALLLIMWSCFLALTSLTCLMYLLMSMALGMGAILYLGYTPGLFIVGLFAILILWMFANFWITGVLFLMAGYLFSLNHARVLVLMATLYALYSVQTRIGWLGVFLSFNLSFFSNDLLAWTLQWCDNVRQNQTQTETVARDDFSRFETQRCQKHNSCGRDDGDDKPKAPSAAVKDTSPPRPPPLPPKETALPPPPPRLSTSTGTTTTSADEMTRILNTLDHYEALGFPRHKKIDLLLLKKEYRKKAMLVHPDKNMGSPLASESFKRLQCAYEVLSDFTKKRDYDEQLKKEESKTRSVCQRSHSSSNQDGSGEYCAEESRRIQCTKCGKSHVWVCTNRSKAKARWCQDCCQYHQAKDGDGWVEHKGSLVFDRPHKVEIPRAFVCAESKVFDVSEWAICQGMACRPNTHWPSFHVNMVGLEKSQRSNSSRFAWDLDAEQEDEEFELWLQQALASGLFCDTSKRRKSWTPFKHTKKQWRRTSC